MEVEIPIASCSYGIGRGKDGTEDGAILDAAETIGNVEKLC